MSVFHPTPVACACGRHFEAALVRSANVGRTPAIRSAILDGSFHRATCPGCGETFNVESVFFYTDVGRGAFYLVLPRSRRTGHRDHAEVLGRAVGAFPKTVLDQSGATVRLVYGLGELREKLVAQDAGYDDRALEYLKAKLLAAHPVLTQTNRVQLQLHEQTSAKVAFVAYHHNRPALYELGMTRSTADREIAKLTDWVGSPPARARRGHAPRARTRLDGFWVNFRNWTTRYDALEVLAALAKDIRAGGTPALAGADFKRMLRTLPRGRDLSTAAKENLTTLFDYARRLKDERVQSKVFEIRFARDLENEWTTNPDHDDIPVLWDVLRALPETHIEGNTSFKSLELTTGGDGSYYEGTIEIGAKLLADTAEVEATLRHEVGHAVNEQARRKIDPWVRRTFGWKISPQDDATNDQWAVAIERWVRAMGGWGPASKEEQAEIAQFLQDGLVQSAEIADNWDPVLMPDFPRRHAWHSHDCPPAEAYRKSGGGSWYTHCKTWLEVASKRFAVNFYYGKLMEVDAKTIDDYVVKMKDEDYYGAMSMEEFFAELYALYYDVPGHPERIIAPKVLSWMRENIGPMKPKNPARPRRIRTGSTGRRRTRPSR